MESMTSVQSVAAATAPGDSSGDAAKLNKKQQSSRLQSKFTINVAACTAYLCDILAVTLPIILAPLAVEEQAASAVGSINHMDFVASKVATISSMASVGGALGMFLNGFVCKELGTYACSKWYLVGLAISTLCFSMSPNNLALGVSYAGMEFFSSIQYASFAIMLSDFHKGKPEESAKALTALGLSATIGEVLSKVLATSLSSAMHWRRAALLGSVAAMFGAVVVSKAPGQAEAKHQATLDEKGPFRLTSITNSLNAILGDVLFWKIALAYSMTFVASISDRVLGPFYHSVTALPLGICGGLTLSITLGLVHGLITASKTTEKLQGPQGLERFLRQRYIKSVGASLGLTALAFVGLSRIPNPHVMAVLLVGLSGIMSSNVAYQYYEMPVLIANRYAGHEAVCISFLDGFGFLFSAPLFAWLGVIVPELGWSTGWGLLSALFAIAGLVMMKSIVPILNMKSVDKQS